MEHERDRVIVVGAGVIGLSIAWQILKSGRPVTIIDRGDELPNCSYGNAGMVVPSHFIPLAAPGVIAKGLKWLANPEGPFFIRPRANFELMRWCKLFASHATEQHTLASRELLRDMHLESRRQFLEIADELETNIASRGLMMLCQTQKGLDEEAQVAAMANELGVGAEVCDAARVRELDSDIDMDVIGGVWFQDDCHMSPGQLMRGLRAALIKLGAEFLEGVEVSALQKQADGSVLLEGVDTPPGLEVVVAAGAWSGEMIKTLGHRMPMQAGKGYSLTLENPRQLPQLCSLLCEAKVAVTPMNGTLRIGGTMEICGNDLSVNPRRVQGIINAACNYFPALDKKDFEGITPWAGLRPCSPDGLPYIGRVRGCRNLTVASGHSMMGLSMAPVTARLVSELLGGEKPYLDISKLDPLRFS